MSKFDIEFYQKEDGTSPAEEFISSLDAKMRAKVGSNISRVLYFFYVGHKIILTNGFIKKTDKTPQNEITRAKRYRADYLGRMENMQ